MGEKWDSKYEHGYYSPTPVLFPGEFHGQRSLVGYSSCGCKEPDTTERLHSLTHSVLIKSTTIIEGKKTKTKNPKETAELVKIQE